MRNRLTFSSRPAWHCTESYSPTAPLEIPGPSLAHSTTRANGLDCHGDSLPATEAGGDFFAFIPRETSLATSIGSVAGKDSPAAILKAGIQASLTALAGAGVATCANLMEDLNRIVCAVSTGDLFATLFFARIDAAHRRLTYVNAGHEPALLVRCHAGRVRLLETTGAVLGLSTRSRYHQKTLPLQQGDVLVAFTDGVSETLAARGGESCHSLVLRTLQEAPGTTAADLVTRILKASTATGDTARPNDKTAVAVRVTPMQTLKLRVAHAAECLSFAAAGPLEAACGGR